MNKPTPGTTWVYLNSEPGLWTVGFYTPEGVWHPDSDYNSREEAAARVRWLNGGAVAEALPELVEACREVMAWVYLPGRSAGEKFTVLAEKALAKIEAKP